MMTSTRFSLVLFSAFLLVSVFSCGDKCEEVREFVRYEPVYVSADIYNQAISFEHAREADNTGLIVSYGNYLFVNEANEGVHMIDNSDPANPVNVGFIVVNNNKHFAIKDGIMLANRYHDLVSIDIRNTNNVHELQRVTNVFPDESEITDDGIIAYYERTTDIEKRDCEDPFFGEWWWEDDMILINSETFNAPTMSSADASSFQAQGNSVASSTARFTISSNSLFVLGGGLLEIFDLSNPGFPQRSNSINVGGDSETLFLLNDYLFIGANSGMSIYDISNANSPQYLSEFSHAFACDPVVANENNAFVTLRAGTTCRGFTNQLDVIDIENISFPSLVSSHSLNNPRGLTLVGEHLFVCDGDQGIAVFNIQNQNDIRQIGNFNDRHANDVLGVSSSVIVVSGDAGIYELDIIDPSQPRLLSVVTSK